jgi:sugar phosphate permease
MNTIKERVLRFKYSGYDKNEKAKKLIIILKNNHIDFICYDNFQYYLFTIRKGILKWKNIIEIVNSVQASKYEYSTIKFYPVDYRQGNGVYGNLQEVSL